MNVLQLLLHGLVEFSVIAAIALGAASLLRRRSAALRHWILSTAVACAALAPLLGAIVPSWQLPIEPLAPTVTRGAGAGPAGTTPGAIGPRIDERGSSTAAAPVSWPSVVRGVAAAWTAGAALNLAILLAGMWRLARVRARARSVADRRWTGIAADVARAYGVQRPVRLLQSDHPTLLVTWGAARPKIVLPRGAADWSEERVRVVLTHELAHVRRGDWAVQIAAEILRSIYWFNPLAWIVCRRLRDESEHAADDAVLSVGIPGRDYAAHLLDVARAVRRHGHMWSPAPAIVRTSTLERRIVAMLDTHLDRTPLTRLARFGSVAALFTLAAVIASAQAAFNTFSGSVVDPMNRMLPNATLVLTNVKTKQKQEVRSDHTGRFEFSELPRGTYELEVKYPGFMVLRGDVELAGAPVQQNLRLEVGTLQETITVRFDPTPAPPEPKPALGPAMQAKILARGRATTECGSTPHGGNLRPPMKVADVRPIYPLHLGNAKVGGVVLMEATIAKDGSIKEVRVVQSAHPELDAAAAAAVKQWRFDSTLLNCMPIEVAMKVKVSFEAS
jgi:TonB family protein